MKAKRIIHGSMMVGLSLLLLLSACSKPAKSQEIVIGVVWPLRTKTICLTKALIWPSGDQ